jgi:hypothetical protein
MLRWLQIEADHVGGFGFEVRIVGAHGPLEPMRLHTGAGPRRLHMIVMNAQDTRQFPRAPMRAAIRRRLLRLREDARLQRRGQHRRLLPLVPGSQSVQALGHKATPPAIEVIATAPERRLDGGIRRAVGQHQDHLGPLGILGTNRPTGRPSFQLRSIVTRQGQRHAAQRTSTELVRTSY